MLYFFLLIAIILYYLVIYFFIVKPRQKELEASNRRFKLIYDLSVRFHENVSLKNSLEKILEDVIETVEADAASLFILDEKKEFFYCSVAVGPTAAEMMKIKVPYGQGIVSEVEKLKSPKLANDVGNEKSHWRDVDEKLKYQTRSLICVPLFVNDDFIGSIEVINKKAGDLFDRSDVDLLDAIANVTAIAINNACLIKKLSDSIKRP